jgi:hypothetical protein
MVQCFITSQWQYTLIEVNAVTCLCAHHWWQQAPVKGENKCTRGWPRSVPMSISNSKSYTWIRTGFSHRVTRSCESKTCGFSSTCGSTGTCKDKYWSLVRNDTREKVPNQGIWWRLRRVEGDHEIHIFSPTGMLEIDRILSHKTQSCAPNLWIWNGTTNLQNIIRHLGMYITNPFSKFSLSSFFSSTACSLLSKVSLFPFPVVWPGLHLCLLALWLSGSLALWTTCFVPVCLQSMCCLLDLSPGFWSPGFPSWWSGVVLSLLGPC